MSLVWVHPIIGSIWGIPSIDGKEKGKPGDGPEHKWIIRGEEKVWRALCNPALEFPMLDFFVFPISGIWQEADRSVADVCPRCSEIDANSYFPP